MAHARTMAGQPAKPYEAPPQVGGDHYRHPIEPIQMIFANGWGVDFCRGNIIKYASRFDRKGSPVEDLRKLQQYAQFLINHYEAQETEGGEGEPIAAEGRG